MEEKHYRNELTSKSWTKNQLKEVSFFMAFRSFARLAKEKGERNLDLH